MTSYLNSLTSSAKVHSRTDFLLMEDELLNFLRTRITDRLDRADTNTESFSYNSSGIYELTGDLDSKGRHKVMAITSLKIDGVEQTFLKDYYIGFRNNDALLGKIRFWNNIADGETFEVSYQYRYGFIFTESPRVDLEVKTYPRVSVQVENSVPEDRCIGGKVTRQSYTLRLTVVDIARTYVTNIIQELKDLFIEESNKHGFQTFDYIRNPKLTPLAVNGEDPNDVVYVQQMDLEIPNQYEISA
jgi:hypothetical protein